MRNFRGPRPVQVAFGMIDRGRWRPAMKLTPIVAALLIAPSMVLAQADKNPTSPEQQPGKTDRTEAPVPPREENGREHAWTQGPHDHLACRLLIAKNNNKT